MVMSIFAEGVDFSGQRPDAMTLRAAGISFVIRYVSAGVHAKEITPTEAAYWKANWFGICIIYESTAARALDGRAAGRADAAVALNETAACGGPPDSVIYFAVDFDARTGEDFARLGDYFAGIRSILPPSRIGVYGSYHVVQWAMATMWCDWYWQTYAWSDGLVAAGIHLYQYKNNVRIGSTAVDLDRAYKPNYGQWGYRPPATHEQEEDMKPILVYGDGTPEYVYYPQTGQLVGLATPIERDVVIKLHTADGGAPVTVHLDSHAEAEALTNFADRAARIPG